ncbi:hypothetical protein DTO021C3_2952 [Paecilomyces variotii]|nr:hypothetical protein DTO195F2_3203 [Paecilomyces variotii]KAJ9289501.1 hypothetical protein DTO021C3_2952 [Paecilomyces variotii]KAJ9388859.1 hypothetical protein DTO063F5_2507 [Paecilomyces variotii]
MGQTKPVLHPLKTPKSATFPSEIHSSSSSEPSAKVKGEECNSTPITPPLAYTEFLKALTPVFTSPRSPSVSFSKLVPEKPITSSTSQPSSATSTSFPAKETIKSASSLPPPGPFPQAQPASKRATLRRLRIPGSVACSPVTETPRSTTSLRSPFSPSEWKLRYFETPTSAGGKPVSVRQVVTRTMTLKRTPLEPPPKGKRRKTDDS